jgi:hypothetical protein
MAVFHARKPCIFGPSVAKGADCREREEAAPCSLPDMNPVSPHLPSRPLAPLLPPLYFVSSQQQKSRRPYV